MIYFDNAATTKPYPEVVDAMLPYLKEDYGNPSTLYRLGQSSKAAIENARKIIADSINASPDEIYFTSGGSESDNWAIKGFMEHHIGSHMITSKIEHPAVLNTCKFLEDHGTKVTYLDVDKRGRVWHQSLEEAIRPDTALVSIMMSNNEIGRCQDVDKFAKICKERGIVFHTDAVQSYGHEHIDVKKSGIDMLSASAHKIHGPKGVGFLYVRKGIQISQLIHGGHQENGHRAGTENVPGIVGLGKAVEITMQNLEQDMIKMHDLSDHLISRVLNEIPGSYMNGDYYDRLQHNVSFSFKGVEGESLLILLDLAGFCVSSGSACMSGEQDASHVLKAIGLSDDLAHGTIRVTLDRDTTKEEIDKIADELVRCVGSLRSSGQ